MTIAYRDTFSASQHNHCNRYGLYCGSSHQCLEISRQHFIASLVRELVGDDDGDPLLVGEGGHAGLVEQGGLSADDRLAFYSTRVRFLALSK